MALQYGMNITASDMKRLLEENDKTQSGIRTWRQLFGGASLGAQAQGGALTSSFSDAVAQAYQANLAQRNAIAGAGLSVGGTQTALGMSRQELHNTYVNYMNNYRSNLAAINENYAKEVGAIDEELTNRAENFSKLYNSAYNYLSNVLAGATINRDVPLYDKDDNFTGYEQIKSDYLTEQGLEWLRDENDNLLSWDVASRQLFNADGSLTKQGIMFYDAMFNARPEGFITEEGESAMGFDEWLSNEDADLREWYASQDPYNFTHAGTNRGTANVLTGRDSTDDLFAQYEYATTHGMEEFTKVNFGEYSTQIRDAVAKLTKADEIARLAITQYEQLEKENVPGAIGAAAAVTKRVQDAYGSAEKAWTTYQTDVGEMTNQLNTFFKQKMGSQIYQQFRENNETLYKQYEELMEEAKASKYHNLATANKINAWYNKVLKEMNKYIEAYGYSGTTSGF